MNGRMNKRMMTERNGWNWEGGRPEWIRLALGQASSYRGSKNKLFAKRSFFFSNSICSSTFPVGRNTEFLYPFGPEWNKK